MTYDSIPIFDVETEEEIDEALPDGMEAGALVWKREGLLVRSASTSDGEDVVVACVGADAPWAAKTAFEALVNHGTLGGVEIHQADERVAVIAAEARGNLAKLEALGWPVTKRVEIFRSFAEQVALFHREGHAVGPMVPEYMPLNDRLVPFLLGPMVAPADPLYSAPESQGGTINDQASDIYSLGRLLHFFVAQGPPPKAEVDDPAKLVELVTYPAGLSRIIRKATRYLPKDRYESVTELLEDLSRYGRYEEVGIAHEDVEEENLGGMSLRPMAPSPEKEEVELPQDDEPIVDHLAVAVEVLKEVQPFRLRQTTRGILLAGGILGLATAFAINYMQGDTTWVRLSLMVTAGLVGFALFTPGIEREPLLRGLFAAFLASATLAVDPAPLIAHFSERAGLKSDNAYERRKSFKAQVERGELEFKGVDLSGANLQAHEFFLSNMEGASLERADLTGATFFKTQLSGVQFRGAKLYAAEFKDSPVHGAIDFDLADCDELTELPDEWGCADGHPKFGAIAETPKDGAPGKQIVLQARVTERNPDRPRESIRGVIP